MGQDPLRPKRMLLRRRIAHGFAGGGNRNYRTPFSGNRYSSISTERGSARAPAIAVVDRSTR